MEVHQQHSNYNHQPKPENKKVLAGVLALVAGGFGAHKFVLGYTLEGILILLSNFLIIPVIGLVTCGLGWGLYIFTAVMPIIEGIIYLSKTDEDFYQTYQVNKKPWF